jgi:hypothetical protein
MAEAANQQRPSPATAGAVPCTGSATRVRSWSTYGGGQGDPYRWGHARQAGRGDWQELRRTSPAGRSCASGSANEKSAPAG